jgi:tetratricopeptide (TPR) repeat protein
MKPVKDCWNMRWMGWAAVLWLMTACASAPPPKETSAEPGAGAESSGGVAPLGEEDRGAKPESGEKIAAVDANAQGDGGPKAPPPVEPLGEEATRLLTVAAQTADSDPMAARKLVEQALSENPRCFQCYYNQGVLLEREGKFDEAIAAYQRVLSLHASYQPAIVNLSNLHVRQGRQEKALSVVSAAVRAAPKDLALRNQLAAVLIAGNKLGDAAEQAKGVLLVDEKNVQAMIHLAQVYYQHKKVELAERILLKAQEIDKNNPVIANRLGFGYIEMDNMASAIASFKKATELDPNFVEAHNNLGVLYLRAHDYGSATEEFRKAIALAPIFGDAYLNLGNALRGDKQYKEAEEAFKKTTVLNPKEIKAYFNLGLLYLDDELPDIERSKRFSVAVDYFEKYQKAGGRNPKLDAYLDEAKKKQDRALKDELRKKQREEEKKKKEEEAKAKAENEAKAKAEAEAKAKEAEEAKKKAEESAVPEKKLGSGKDEPASVPGSKLGGGKDTDAGAAIEKPKNGKKEKKAPPGKKKVGQDEK